MWSLYIWGNGYLLGMDYYQDESIRWMVIKDRGRTNIYCYAWYIPLLTKSPGCGRGRNPCGIRGYFPFVRILQVFKRTWPQPMVTSCIEGKVRLVNTTDDPQVWRSQYLCQAITTYTPPTTSSPSTLRHPTSKHPEEPLPSVKHESW